MKGLHGDDQHEEEITKMGTIGPCNAGKVVFRPGPNRASGWLRSSFWSSGWAKRWEGTAGRGASITGESGSGAGGGRRGENQPGRVEHDPPGLTRNRGERTERAGGFSAKRNFFVLK